MPSSAIWICVIKCQHEKFYFMFIVLCKISWSFKFTSHTFSQTFELNLIKANLICKYEKLGFGIIEMLQGAILFKSERRDRLIVFGVAAPSFNCRDLQKQVFQMSFHSSPFNLQLPIILLIRQHGCLIESA